MCGLVSRRVLGTAAAGFGLMFLTGCPAPQIIGWDITPMPACPDGLVEIAWNVDADSVTFRVDQPTVDGPLPRRTPLVGRNRLGFHVGRTDTTFTLIAHRWPNPDVVETKRVTVLPGPVTESLLLQYECRTHAWNSEGPGGYPAELKVTSIRNMAPYPIKLFHNSVSSVTIAAGGVLTPSAESGVVLNGPWTAYREDGVSGPDCPPEPRVGEPPPVPYVRPDPISLVVTAACPGP